MSEEKELTNARIREIIEEAENNMSYKFYKNMSFVIEQAKLILKAREEKNDE